MNRKNTIQTQKHALKIYVMDCTNSLARISVRMDKEIEAGHTTLHELIED